MKLYEYEAKDIFKNYGIPVPKGKVASTPEEAYEIAEEIGRPVVVKAQVLVAGRGKAGGIKKASTPEEAREIAKELLGSEIKGLKVKEVLVEELLDIERELYLSMTIDRFSRRITLLASTEGGVDIEEVAAKSPEKIVKYQIDPLVGLQSYIARKVVKKLRLRDKQASETIKTIFGMYKIMIDKDCELVESNPFTLLRDGRVVAADARIIVDDNAIYRHPDFQQKYLEYRDMSPLEVRAKKHGFSYVEVEGNIGIIGNGAGLTMATMDMVKYYGGRPANFLDIGGGARAEVVKEALKILLEHPKVEVVFVNILGGITRCDEVARGIVEALSEGPKKKVVVRMMGTREEEGKEILRKEGIEAYDSMEEAARAAVELARR